MSPEAENAENVLRNRILTKGFAGARLDFDGMSPLHKKENAL